MSKVLMIHHSGIIGGAGVSFINSVKNIALFHDVTVYVPSDPLDIYEKLNKIKNQYHFKLCTYGRRIGAFTYYSGGDTLLQMRLYYRLALALKQAAYWNKVIKNLNPDIVILNSKILSWMSQLRELKMRKSICFVRETMRGRRTSLPNRLIAHYLDGFTKVVFLSEYDRKKEKLIKANTYVVHNYVDDEQFDLTIPRIDARKQLGIPEDVFIVLYVGGVSEMKGFDLAVDAVLNMEQKVELLVVGNTFEDVEHNHSVKMHQYISFWKNKIKELDKNGRIHILGRKNNMSPYYAACDVLLFPMRSPHQSRPVFEAGYFSKPVIIADFDNISEFVRDSYNGFRVPPDNSTAILEKIRVLYENPQLCIKLGVNNKVNTERLHDRRKNTDLIRRIIEGEI